METFGDAVAESLVKQFAWKGGDNLDSLETSSPNGCFAGAHDGAPNPASGEIRVNEERANTRGISGGVEQGVLLRSRLIATELRLPTTPSTTGDELILMIGDVVGAVLNELSINTEHWPERGFDLGWGIMLLLQFARRDSDECFKLARIFQSRWAKMPVGLTRFSVHVATVCSSG